MHSDEQLQEMAKNSERKYKLTGQQRAMETKLRTLKAQRTALSAAGDEIGAKQVQKKINEQQKAYRQFSEKNNLLYDTKRASVEGYRRISVKETDKALNKSTNNDIISTVDESKAVKDVHYVGKINKDIYSCVTKDIATDEVIITDERIQHIKERHPNDFERYSEYIRLAVENPDYIIEANKPNTAFVLKSITDNDLNFQMILRLITSNDIKNYKNSVITFLKVEEKRYNRYLRTKKILYKSE